MNEHSDFDVIWEFQRRLVNICDQENLKSIQGLDNSFEINGENVLSSFMIARIKGQSIYKPLEENETLKFDFNNLNSDLILISNEILHFTGLTCLYSKYLTGPLDNPVPFNGEIVYTIRQDIPDKRFFMYATCAFEKLYNYWDRIGDLLAAYFPENIKPQSVYFSKIDKFIPNAIQVNENVKWLIEFKENEFSELNKLRIGVVHYENLDTAYTSQHLSQSMNRSQLEILQSKKSQLIPMLKSHISLTLEGYLRIIRVMEYLNEEILTDDLIEEKRIAVHNVA